MAAMVSALGTSGSNGRAFSRAMRTNRSRKASDTVKPMAARTAAASSLIASSIRARTTVFAIRSLLTSLEILSYIVAQPISLSSMHGIVCHQWWFLTRAVRGQRVSLFTSDAVGNEPWRCEQALSGRWPSLHKHHRLRWRCAPAGTAPQGCGIRSTPSHTPLITENNNQGMLASRLVLPPYGWVLWRALPLLAVSMVAPPYHFLGAALRAALGCLPGRRRPAPKRGAARPAPVLLRAVLPPCKASQETAGRRSGVKASALRCAPTGGAWARAGVAARTMRSLLASSPRRWTRPH